MATLSIASPASRTSPFVGPRPFTRSDTLAGRDMYGRDPEIEALFNMLIAQRIVVVYSPSGAGKTSLIEAKLVPRLEAEGFYVLPTARVGLITDPAAWRAQADNRYVLSTLSTLGGEP